MEQFTKEIALAAAAISKARWLLIGAGAGMGVDSGMPDFRGENGFWKAYPAFRGRQFSEMSNPAWFRDDPQLAWGFFGHRYNLYSNTTPHRGFQILRSWCDRVEDYAVFTSNVDGHFHKSGFAEDHITECHGSIHHMQCTGHCNDSIWAAPSLELDVDEETIRAKGPLPQCPDCGALARPNILMFGDYGWLSHRSDKQMHRFGRWLESIDPDHLAVVEMGAGTAIPTVRMVCESAGGTLIRINPRDPDLADPDKSIAIAAGALETLAAIDEAM